MIQCEECEFFSRSSDGRPVLLCDPYGSIKEPECIQKWQLVRLESLSRAYQITAETHQRLAPLQERMIRHMEREINEAEEADQWKLGLADDDDDDDD